ncbi:hypothetical protein VOM14_25975 [Paraburkholderia sp. MPAMCS5]|uniref:hypothetical protein n=1 Tax=Paraburkholderia sp. MPAMCS5 TaxID=3112563 RepID=UPI002E18403E|nr:hypothetical protein [Paraburkholderia sp. MPAMCS5]
MAGTNVRKKRAAYALRAQFNGVQYFWGYGVVVGKKRLSPTFPLPRGFSARAVIGGQSNPFLRDFFC